MNSETDFEEWAKLLIIRKVPRNFTRLRGPDVIHSGADILKRGESFEVHLESTAAAALSSSAPGRVFVTPMPHFHRAPHDCLASKKLICGSHESPCRQF